MSNFVVLTIAKTNRRIAMDFSDKKITAVGESFMKDLGQRCTSIIYKEIKSKNGLMSIPDYEKEETLEVKENFDEVLNRLGIAGDDK